MNKPGGMGAGMTPAQSAANALFKPLPLALSGEQQARIDFEENRERLKALRLAKEAKEREQNGVEHD